MSTARLERLIQGGLLALVAIMPFHAFLATWLGSVIGYRSIIQGWKELLLCALAVLAIALAIREPARLQRLRQPAFLLLGGFIAMALVVTLILRPPLAVAIFGLKTDGEFLAAAILAALVASPQLMKQLIMTTLVVGVVVVSFGLLQSLVLPPDFLIHFGYGPDTIAPFQRLDSDTPALRFSATLGGPNQLGTYLILVIALAMALWQRRRTWWLGPLAIGSVIVLFHTHSRGAWIGAILAMGIVTIGRLPRRWQLRAGGAALLLAVSFIATLPALLQPNSPWQRYLLHGNDTYNQGRGSDFEHLASLQSGWQAVITEPLGHGLGTAGPAVFHTGVGRIIENYYLQLGYEAGVVAMILFMVGLVLLGKALWRQTRTHPAALGLTAALIGISLNATVLPAWTDSTITLCFWILAGGMIPIGNIQRKSHHVTTD